MSDTSSKSKYWRSVGELCDTPEFRAQLEAEFPTEDSPAGFSRRRMLQLMGASMVLASAASCRWEEREILPFNKRPQNCTPGKFEKYATAMELGGTVLGLMVTCVDGRPIKVEGNPKHPNSMGATNAYAQAAILELYDPDRSQNIIEKTPQGDMARSWEQFSEFAKKHFEEYRKNGGEGLAILADPGSSPTIVRLRKSLLESFPKAMWSPSDSTIEKNWAMYELSDAKIIICLDVDLFGTHPDAVKYSAQFAKARNAGKSDMSRLYVVESRYTITGAMADHRLSMKSEDIAKLPHLIRKAIADKSSLSEVEKEISPAAFSFLQALSDDVKQHAEKSLFIVDEKSYAGFFNGSMTSSSHSNDLKITPNYKYVSFKTNSESRIKEFAQLSESMKNGRISTLLLLGGNPIYDSPADLDFAAGLDKVATKIHLSLYRNETSLACNWHLPQAHLFETWSDVKPSSGLYSIGQPLIEPLHGGKSSIEVLNLLLEKKETVQDSVRATFKEICSPDAKDYEKKWSLALCDGIANEDLTIDLETLNFPGAVEKTLHFNSSIENGKLEITFRPSPAVYDGRFANLSWLQEMPDPITRLTWDNVALFSPATAEKLGVKHEEVVRLKFKGREIEIPAYILPGQADGSVAVTLGYGRTAAGKVGGSEKDGVAPVGVNTYKLRTSDAMWFGTGLTVEPTGKKHPLASVAEHFAINKDSIGEEGRKERLGELVREATLAEYQKNPEFAKEKVEHPPLESLWNEHEYDGHHWGMTVDLSKCVGCGACVVACMAENNVPVVGKERIFKNREMHWLRIDRYFRGDIANPEIVFQPVMCQQCELAPCEGVCPVGATSHSKEGLNDMVYNRCVGTRYCANNCPYKVRRFNFFNYHKQYEDPANEVLKMASNPQVTVRMRGVMEKCTYCVQRIQAVKIEAKNEKRTIQDGEIRTACQQVCPAGAIVFGDLSDKNSEVSKLLADNRSYQMLGELNTKPRTTYLARIRNPNPELEKKEK
jgi:molybdopterin-containing oxidoreductase family iron-sulfur binding subunit